MSIVSSNEAFNRLYELAGHEGLNRRMQAAGLSGTVFTHRLVAPLRRGQPQDAAHRPGTPDGVVTLPEAAAALERCRVAGHRIRRRLPGARHRQARRDAHVVRRQEPHMSLVDLQNMLVMIMRPDVDHWACRASNWGQGPRVPEEAMRQRRASRRIPSSRRTSTTPGGSSRCSGSLLRLGPTERWIVYSKAGKAYGFRIENAFVFDAKTKKISSSP
ncbi:MAG: serine hydrolase [bacterium]